MTVLVLVFLPALFGPRRSDQPLWSRSRSRLKLAALVAFIAIVGARVPMAARSGRRRRVA